MTKSQRDDIDRVIRKTLLRAVIYARVSTDKQEEDGTSLDTQVENSQAWALGRGYIVVKIFRETDTGWLYRERKDLTTLRQMARNHEFDVLIINTFDRFSRNQTHFAVLVEEMEHLKIRIDCVKENFDDSPMGRFMRNAYGFVAEVEREKIIGRTSDGKKKRIESGKLMPGNKPRYGYIWTDARQKEKGTLSVLKAEGDEVIKMFRYFATIKSSCQGLTNWLTEREVPTPRGVKTRWNRAVVYEILTDPIYIGKAYANRYKGHSLRPKEEWIPMPEGTAPAILVKEDGTPDYELFDRVQELLLINRKESLRNNPKGEATELLRCGFVRCGYCKRAMVVNRYTRKRKHDETKECFYCCRYYYRGDPLCKKSPCIEASRLDKVVWIYVGQLIEDFTIVEKAIKLAKKKGGFEPDLEGIERSIKSAQANQDELIKELNEKDETGQYKKKGRSRERWQAEIALLDEHLAELEEEKQKIRSGQMRWEVYQEEVDKFVSWILNFRETYPTATYEEKRRCLRHLGITVFVYRKDDTEHEQYEIKVKIAEIGDIMLPSSWFKQHNQTFFLISAGPKGWSINPDLLSS